MSDEHGGRSGTLHQQMKPDSPPGGPVPQSLQRCQPAAAVAKTHNPAVELPANSGSFTRLHGPDAHIREGSCSRLH